jgi:hypothetical protein
MGHTTHISAEQRARLLHIAQDMLRDGSSVDVPARARLEAAVRALSNEGPQSTLDLARTIFQLGDPRQRMAARLIGDAAAGREFGLGRFSREMLLFSSPAYARDGNPLDAETLPGFLAAGEAFRRAEDYLNILGSDPAQAIDSIFKPFASEREARETLLGTGGESAYGVLLRTVRERVSGQIIATFSGSGGEVIIPRPLCFREELAERLDVDLETIMLWERTAFWKPALAAFFAQILAGGVDRSTSVVDDQAGVEALASAIALKEEWFQFLQRHGCSLAYLERMIGIHFAADAFSRIFALSEFQRFAPSSSAKPWQHALAPDVLYKNMTALHALAPMLEGQEFVRLLTPLAAPLDLRTLDHLMARHRRDPMEFKRHHAANILAWHTESPIVFARRLTGLVMKNRKYGSLKRFLAFTFSVRIEHLREKLAGMMKEGIDIAPIIEALQLRFGAQAKQRSMAIDTASAAPALTPSSGYPDAVPGSPAVPSASVPAGADVAAAAAMTSGGVQAVLPFVLQPPGAMK